MIARVQADSASEERNFAARMRIDRARESKGFLDNHSLNFHSIIRIRTHLVMQFVRRVINLDPRGPLSSFSRGTLVNLTDCRMIG